MIENSNLKFRRQFLFSAKECKELIDWKSQYLGSHFLYVHPDCELNKASYANNELYLIGYVISPYFPEKTSLQILEYISKFKNIEDIPELLYSLSGRFILIIKQKERFTFFNDACGFRQIFYTKFEDKIFAASQPLLLKMVVEIKKSSNYETYMNSAYIKSQREHYLPSGISLYENVFQLVPNHYLDSSDYAQKRFWPLKAKTEISLQQSIERISKLLIATINTAHKRYNLALPLTSGKDSRIILSSCKDIVDDIFVYTLQYRDLTEKSSDIEIPKNLADRFGFKHHLIDCRDKQKDGFLDIYNQNSDLAHWNDWGEIAAGMYEEFPQDRMALKGNCFEIGRCTYYKRGKHTKIKSSKRFHIMYGGSDLEFIRKRIEEWYNEVKDIDDELGYDLFDLFYWENRMGSWQAQSQLEWDIVQEAFTPFNNRELIDLMLSVDTKFRCKPHYHFFNMLVNKMWEETLVEPFNPSSYFSRLKLTIKDILIYFDIKPGLFKMKFN